MRGARIELDGSIEEKGGQQFVSGQGLFSDKYTRVHRIEPHGFMSNPIKGAKALLVAPTGRPDHAFVLGGEHPTHRPAGLPAGASAIYDSGGNIIRLVGDGIVVDVAGRSITITAGTWTLTGNATINGDLEVNGNIHATGSIIDEGGNTNHHSH
ncbi:phage gp45-like [Neorhizobium galegae]|uniref:phage baseplate assembly protein domain-containing protein n=1 Tax=Neorhizobium galegae TaxID=399 RepID=UPI001AEB2E23|nr:phage baseplate assembly protein [Neorhizobium galegae]MBP2560855.1 phage gp45-like [Neorhizobium galegae]